MKEVVIVAATRSAVGGFGKSLKPFEAKELGAYTLEALMSRTEIGKDEVDEIIFGHGYVHGGGLNSARIASQKVGFPTSVPAYIVIKACGSSLKAITNAASSIIAGDANVIIAGGVESMTNVPYLVKNRWGNKFGNIEMKDALLEDGLICSIEHQHMGVTAENLVEKYNISRLRQDEFARNSHLKAAEAIKVGKFNEEIFPIYIEKKNEEVVFQQDESVRQDVSLEKLSKLPAVFIKEGTVTAGNSCPMNDGGAAVLITSSEYALKKNIQPLVKIIAYASAGVEANIMGIGPVQSTKKALQKANLKLEEIDLIELNEAFAAQAIAVIDELNLDESKVNVNGGAIALGHPVGATGAKLTTTLIYEMLRREVKYGLVTMCMAGGMGITVIYENAQI